MIKPLLKQTMTQGMGPLTAAASYFLDDYPGASEACSIFQLSSTYTTCCRIKVIDGVTNPEYEIGFVDRLIDIATIATLGGSDPVQIVRLDDQTGNGRHWTQASTSQQFIIYNGTTINVDPVNGYPAFGRNGTGSGMQTAAWTAENTPDTILSTFEGDGSTGYVTDGLDGSNRRFLLSTTDLKAGSGATLTASSEGGGTHQVTVLYGASGYIRKDGAAIATGTTGTQQVTGLTIGNSNAIASFSIKNLQEIIRYTGDQTATVPAMETNRIAAFTP